MLWTLDRKTSRGARKSLRILQCKKTDLEQVWQLNVVVFFQTYQQGINIWPANCATGDRAVRCFRSTHRFRSTLTISRPNMTTPTLKAAIRCFWTLNVGSFEPRTWCIFNKTFIHFSHLHTFLLHMFKRDQHLRWILFLQDWRQGAGGCRDGRCVVASWGLGQLSGKTFGDSAVSVTEKQKEREKRSDSVDEEMS